MSRTVLMTLADRGDRADKLASVIQALAKAIFDPEVGEFAEYKFQGVSCRTFPRTWWTRLDSAIRTDAIDQFSAAEIVEIMLRGPR